MSRLNARLLAAVSEGEEVLALGDGLEVTMDRIIRPGHESPVSIPFASITRYESWSDAPRWAIRLFHASIDPQWGPYPHTQWWRGIVGDRRAYRRGLERARLETVLQFSREHTKAADAIAARVDQLGIEHQVLPESPFPPRTGSDMLLFGRYLARPRRPEYR